MEDIKFDLTEILDADDLRSAVMDLKRSTARWLVPNTVQTLYILLDVDSYSTLENLIMELILQITSTTDLRIDDYDKHTRYFNHFVFNEDKYLEKYFTFYGVTFVCFRDVPPEMKNKIIVDVRKTEFITHIF